MSLRWKNVGRLWGYLQERMCALVQETNRHLLLYVSLLHCATELLEAYRTVVVDVRFGNRALGDALQL